MTGRHLITGKKQKKNKTKHLPAMTSPTGVRLTYSNLQRAAPQRLESDAGFNLLKSRRAQRADTVGVNRDDHLRTANKGSSVSVPTC